MNYNITIGLVSVIFIASCSYKPFAFNTKKTLSYQFDQPKRQQIAKNQAIRLGTPLKDSNSNAQYYYSANGDICRMLSAQHAACYINNKWYESINIMPSGR